MADQDPRKELGILINSNYPIIYLETWEETRATEILRRVAEDLNVAMYEWAVTTGMALAGGAPLYNSQEPGQALATITSISHDALFLLKDFHKYLDQDVIVRKLRDLSEHFSRARRALIISSPVVTVPIELEKDTVRYTLTLPPASELNQLVTATLRELVEKYRALNQLAPEQMPGVVRSLGGLTLEEARRIFSQAVLEDGRCDAHTIDRILDAKSQFIKDQGVLEFLKVESGLEAVAGLAHLKAWLATRRGALSPEAARFGLEPPKGILIMGMPGCGKSLCAKAVAREWNMQLLRFDTSNLFEKYIGESEKNLRKSLQVAEAVAPAVLWIDEIEKMFPRASLSSDADGGLSMRIFGSLLNWLQEKTSPVFVVATSNDISSLPPEFLRKGRFDEIFFVDLPNATERASIFAIQLQRRKQAFRRFDLAELAAASQGFTGAEIEQAVTSGLYAAFAQKTPLSTELLLKELQSTYPLSVTMKEKLDALRAWAQERAVPAN
jgi:hypothetical protein